MNRFSKMQLGGSIMKNIAKGLVIGLCVGSLGAYSYMTNHDDVKMKEQERKIDSLTKDLAAEQQKAVESLSRLQDIEDRKKEIDQKLKGDFDELQKTNTEIKDVVKRLKVQVQILHKALCDYSSDFSTQSVRDNAGQR
jgi:septal ring factor EnvC (AmiA/AmiB activator)